MAGPALKAPARAQQARGAVERGAGRFGKDAALARPEGSQHGVAVAHLAEPATGRQERRGVVRAQRGHVLGGARVVAAVEERLAGEVDAGGGALTGDADGHGDVRAVGVGHGAGAAGVEDDV